MEHTTTGDHPGFPDTGRQTGDCGPAMMVVEKEEKRAVVVDVDRQISPQCVYCLLYCMYPVCSKQRVKMVIILCGTNKACYFFFFFFYLCMQNNFVSFKPNFIQTNYMD